MITIAEFNGVFEGSFAGDVIEYVTISTHSDGTIASTGHAVCDPCTVNGRTGTMIYSLAGIGFTDGTFTGRITFLRGTGEITDIGGSVIFEGSFTSPFEFSGTYSGNITFDSDSD